MFHAFLETSKGHETWFTTISTIFRTLANPSSEACPHLFAKPSNFNLPMLFNKCLCNSGMISGTHQTRFEKTEQIIWGNHEETIVLETNRKPNMGWPKMPERMPTSKTQFYQQEFSLDIQGHHCSFSIAFPLGALLPNGQVSFEFVVKRHPLTSRGHFCWIRTYVPASSHVQPNSADCQSMRATEYCRLCIRKKFAMQQMATGQLEEAGDVSHHVEKCGFDAADDSWVRATKLEHVALFGTKRHFWKDVKCVRSILLSFRCCQYIEGKPYRCAWGRVDKAEGSGGQTWELNISVGPKSWKSSKSEV